MLNVFTTTYVCFMLYSDMSIMLLDMVIIPKKELLSECAKMHNETATDINSTSDDSEPILEQTHRFHWNEAIQANILSAFLWGFAFGSLPGGTIAEWIGPFRTIFYAFLISAVLNSALVWLAPIHWGFLVAVRAISGLLGGMVYPALLCLIGRWAPPQEKSKFVACMMGYTLGICVTWTVGGIVSKHYRWPWGFHVMTLQIVIYLVPFYLLTFDSPEDHKWITQKELEYIKYSQEGTVSKTRVVPPYKAMFKSVPFWTLIILHFGNLYGLNVQITAVPKYMKEFIGFDIQSSGAASSMPHIVRLFLGLGFGFLGDYLKKKKFRREMILKSFIVLSHIIPGLLMGAMAASKCNAEVAIAILTLSMSINGAAVVTNLANPLDLSPNFAGTIFGFMFFIGGMAGLIVPSVTAAILDAHGNDTNSWGSIFALGGILYCSCGIFFIMFGSGDVQPWNEK